MGAAAGLMCHLAGMGSAFVVALGLVGVGVPAVGADLWNRRRPIPGLGFEQPAQPFNSEIQRISGHVAWGCLGGVRLLGSNGFGASGSGKRLRLWQVCTLVAAPETKKRGAYEKREAQISN